MKNQAPQIQKPDVESKNMLVCYFRKNENPATKQERKNNKDIVVGGILKGSVLQIHTAICSKNQQFVRAAGRNIALNRALNSPIMKIDLGDADRKKTMETFRNLAIEIKENINNYLIPVQERAENFNKKWKTV